METRVTGSGAQTDCYAHNKSFLVSNSYLTKSRISHSHNKQLLIFHFGGDCTFSTHGNENDMAATPGQDEVRCDPRTKPPTFSAKDAASLASHLFQQSSPFPAQSISTAAASASYSQPSSLVDQIHQTIAMLLTNAGGDSG